MIHRLHHMICGPTGPTTSLRVADRTLWVRAVPLPFYGGLIERCSDAWAVLTERAYAIRWPEAGDVERAYFGSTALSPPSRSPTMTNPNDDLREMVARALVATDVRVSENKEMDLYGQMADAALAVASPAIWREAMEAAAKEVEAILEGGSQVHSHAATRIRSLTPPATEDTP